VDVQIYDQHSNTLLLRRTDIKASSINVTSLPAHRLVQVRVYPKRHRPVGHFVLTGGGSKAQPLRIFFALHPDHAAPDFPDFSALPAGLRKVLDASTLEGTSVSAGNGAALYDGLQPTQKAGLLNVFGKMSQVALGGLTCWDYVTDVYRIRGDRIFINVNVDFRDRVKGAVANGRFKEVDGSLHTPPDNCEAAGSFKTRDHYGNLQLTFFCTKTGPKSFCVDADIDDAGGIGHVFQVLDHWLTGGETHPYDIHQILSHHQKLTLPYELGVA
jgi:hypothetical protein